MPPAPVAAGAFGARNLPRLVLKSGYGPDNNYKKDQKVNKKIKLSKNNNSN